MTATYEPISTQTLGTAIADIYFTSIPQTYTDLVLVCNMNGASHLTVGFRVNGSSSTIYSATELAGNGFGALTNRVSNENYARMTNYGGPDTTGRSVLISSFMNYSNTTTNKTVLNRANNAGGSFPGSQAGVNLVRTTSAITSINLMTASGGNFAVGSTFTLYGIKAAA